MENPLSYNTQIDPIILKEYGRSIQNIANYITTIENEEERIRLANNLIQLMKQVNPKLKDTDLTARLWNHMYVISDFKLHFDNPPFPQPEKEVFFQKPRKVEYNQRHLKDKHYGYNVHLVIEKALAIENEEERHMAAIGLGRILKSFQKSYNTENITDEVIAKNIYDLSKGQLKVDLEFVKKYDLFNQEFKTTILPQVAPLKPVKRVKGQPVVNKRIRVRKRKKKESI